MKNLILILLVLSLRVAAQDVVKKAPEVKEGDGPYPQLIIRGVMLIDGTGSPPVGPVDIVVRQNKIVSITSLGLPTPGMASSSNRPDQMPSMSSSFGWRTALPPSVSPDQAMAWHGYSTRKTKARKISSPHPASKPT